jgi:hypothetical protein
VPLQTRDWMQKLDGVVPCELSKNVFGVDQWWVLKKRK